MNCAGPSAISSPLAEVAMVNALAGQCRSIFVRLLPHQMPCNRPDKGRPVGRVADYENCYIRRNPNASVGYPYVKRAHLYEEGSRIHEIGAAKEESFLAWSHALRGLLAAALCRRNSKENNELQSRKRRCQMLRQSPRLLPRSSIFRMNNSIRDKAPEFRPRRSSRAGLDAAATEVGRVTAIALVPNCNSIPTDAHVRGNDAPIGSGHVYAPAHYIDASIEVIDVRNWSAEKITRLKQHYSKCVKSADKSGGIDCFGAQNDILPDFCSWTYDPPV